MTVAPSFRVLRCASCHVHFLPRPGLCPKCGSRSVRPELISPAGRVLAATELHGPPAEGAAPHRIALVELAGGVRVLAVAPGRLPALGETVEVAAVGDHMELRAEPETSGGTARPPGGTRGGGLSADRVRPGPPLNPRGETTTGLAIQRLAGLGHPRSGGPTEGAP